MSLRTEKFASTLRAALAEIVLHDLDNPHLKFVTFARVAVSPDLRHAKIGVSSFAPEADWFPALQASAGAIAHHLGKRMYLKFVPRLHFVQDTAFDTDQKLAHLERREKK